MSSAPMPEHQVVSASAGTGKTYRLTNRFIQIMAAQKEPAPERILAITFTRKASGEFIDGILGKLADAAQDEEKAAELGEAIELLPKKRNCDYFYELLQSFIKSLPRLNLMTIDSFFNRILKNFALEFGLGGRVALMDEYEKEREKEKVLSSMFFSSAVSDEVRKTLLHAVNQISFGNERVVMLKLLEEVIQNHYELFLTVDDGRLWGNEKKIWGPQGIRWREVSRADFELACVETQTAITSDDSNWTATEVKNWRAFGERMLRWMPGVKMKAPWNKLVEFEGELRSGHCPMIMRKGGKPRNVSKPGCDALVTILDYVMHQVISSKLEETKGMYGLMTVYDREYDRSVRSRGMLSFADIPLILKRASLSRHDKTDSADLEQLRLNIDYRLDASYDHWLLDEFQDTSRLQWSVMQNLADEVLSDQSGERSFFYVGDIKQSLYGWRGGDSKLFSDIHQHYKGILGEGKQLFESYRSAPDVLKMVNLVFSDMAVIEEKYGAGAAELWRDVSWMDHQVPESREDMVGYSLLTVVNECDDQLSAKYGEILKILQEVRPWERRLSAVVLCTKNNECSAIVDFIRAADSTIPVAGELDTPVAIDNPYTFVLMSLLKLCICPNDDFSRQHILMTPLAACIHDWKEKEDAEASLDHYAQLLLEEIHESGFEEALRKLNSRFLEYINADAFQKRRADQFCEAAGLYDAKGNRSVFGFLDYLQSYTVREGATDSSVQVMTIHKSKGLGFDMVILPDLKGNTIREWKGRTGVKKQDSEIQWVLSPPNADYREHEPVLKAFDEELKDEQCYERLCNLYVAMTRAKHGLYMIVEQVKETKDGFETGGDYRGLLLETIVGGSKHLEADAEIVSDQGDARWYEKVGKAPTEKTVEVEIPTVDAPTHKKLKRETPSSVKGDYDHHEEPQEVIEEADVDARELGNAVHAIFEKLEWLEEDAVQKLKDFSETLACDEKVKAKATDMVQACLKSDSLKDAFKQPEAKVDLWLEKGFDVLVDDQWIGGYFDRVEIYRNDSAEITEARIIDYKTNRITEDDFNKHLRDLCGSQLKAYRKALGKMLDLAEDKISCHLVAVRTGEIVDI